MVRGKSKTVRTYLPDALTGIATFAMTLLIAGGSNTVSAASGAEPFGMGSNSGALLIAAAFAVTAALNMSFFRYLYRTYALPRRIAARRRAKRSNLG